MPRPDIRKKLRARGMAPEELPKASRQDIRDFLFIEDKYPEGMDQKLKTTDADIARFRDELDALALGGAPEMPRSYPASGHTRPPEMGQTFPPSGPAQPPQIGQTFAPSGPPQAPAMAQSYQPSGRPLTPEEVQAAVAAGHISPETARMLSPQAPVAAPPPVAKDEFERKRTLLALRNNDG